MPNSDRRSKKQRMKEQKSHEIKELSPESIKETISGIQKAIRENYVFPEQSEGLCQSLDDHYAKGDYNQIPDPRILAENLTQHLREIEPDKHLQVLLPDEMPSLRQRGIDKTEPTITRVEILPGNIGYIKIAKFNNLVISANKINGAMLLVKDTEALIFDLRDGRGGNANSTNFLLSYLFDTESTELLLEMYFRPDDITFQNHTSWTPFTYLNPVYVLTSGITFSACEHFAFALKIHQKATLVGSNTGGGAHPVTFVELETGLIFKVPIGRTYDPETGTDWEGTGVIPDIRCSVDVAFIEAQKDILDKMIAKTDDEERKEELIKLKSALGNNSF